MIAVIGFDSMKDESQAATFKVQLQKTHDNRYSMSINLILTWNLFSVAYYLYRYFDSGGGGGALRYRGGHHPRDLFRGRRGLFFRPPHVRDFVKGGYFFVPRYEVWGGGGGGGGVYNPRNIRGPDAE